ncbi:MAG: hypothetical protein ACQEWU_18715 [Bacillota bacterium]|uniref:hypothetical protein n=1 Tax=Virgibacillus sp. AGTR TaxID=2812055 RepID=UPI001D1657AF|nr:hypothetical protein [Virgibacillus sp. AGTR]MCC2251961.1 hypothetical protein [Virgibacillus sp. AGTR]
MKPINYNSIDVQTKLAEKISELEMQLASEFVAKKAVIRYAEELEQKLEKYENELNNK